MCEFFNYNVFLQGMWNFCNCSNGHSKTRVQMITVCTKWMEVCFPIAQQVRKTHKTSLLKRDNVSTSFTKSTCFLDFLSFTKKSDPRRVNWMQNRNKTIYCKLNSKRAEVECSETLVRLLLYPSLLLQHLLPCLISSLKAELSAAILERDFFPSGFEIFESMLNKLVNDLQEPCDENMLP